MSLNHNMVASSSLPRRMFTLANVGAVVIGIGSFLVLVRAWNSHIGSLLAALVAGIVTGVAWLLWNRLSAGPPLAKVIPGTLLGIIPSTPALPTPTLTQPGSPAAEAYLAAARQLASATTGQVVLVSSPAPGQGASTVALNLAIGATQEGRRLLLVDGDLATSGLSRFGHTGTTPGLTELAQGTATLVEASRLWLIDADNRLPFIPAGSRSNDPTVLQGPSLADAVDQITEHADLMLINASPPGWDENQQALAAHADGTVLVVTERGDRAQIAEACRRLEEMGAPVVGYVVNHSSQHRAAPEHWLRRALKRVVATTAVIVLAYTGWSGYQIWHSWNSVERNQFDIETALEVLPPVPADLFQTTDLTPETASAITAVPSDREFTTYMIVGSDLGGERADVIILALFPTNGDPPLMVSLPRDLYVVNRCTQGFDRLNANLGGCGDAVNGPTLLALAVEDFTGIPVDHFALFDFDGFQRIIDQVGGVEICVEHDVRDSKSNLDLKAGCTNADGEQALAWVRSRHTLELVNGRWRSMPGVNDLARNERQQDVIIAMFNKVRAFHSLNDLTRTVRSLTDAFTLDDQLGVTDAIKLAWGLRNIDPSTIVRLQVPVADYTTSQGAAVLIPTASFDTVITEYYGIASGEAS